MRLHQKPLHERETWICELCDEPFVCIEPTNPVCPRCGNNDKNALSVVEQSQAENEDSSSDEQLSN